MLGAGELAGLFAEIHCAADELAPEGAGDRAAAMTSGPATLPAGSRTWRVTVELLSTL